VLPAKARRKHESGQFATALKRILMHRWAPGGTMKRGLVPGIVTNCSELVVKNSICVRVTLLIGAPHKVVTIAALAVEIMLTKANERTAAYLRVFM
jgi:hypothetical protein